MLNKTFIIFIISSAMVGKGPVLIAETLKEKLNEQFYHHSQAIRFQELKSRILFLQTWIQEHPQFLPAYEFLYEIYLKNNMLNEAGHYFGSLKKSQRHYLGSQWISAKLEYGKNRPDNANRFYAQLLQGSRFPSCIGIDYLLFDHRSYFQYSAIDTLRKRLKKVQNKQTLLCYEAIHLYLNDQYLRADSLFVQSNIDHLKDGLFRYYYGANLFRLGRYDDCRRVMERALADARDSGNLEFQVLFLNYLFTIYTYLGENDVAVEHLEQANHMVEKIDDFSLRLRITTNFAYLNRLRGLNQKAVHQFSKAAKGFELLRDYERAARCYYHLAKVEKGLSLFYKALESAKKSMYYFQCVDEKYEIVRVLLLYADILNYFEQHETARRFILKAKDIVQLYNFTTLIKEIDVELAMLEAEDSSEREAKRTYLNLLARQDNPVSVNNTVLCYLKLGELYFKSQSIDSASWSYGRALDFSSKHHRKYLKSWAVQRLSKVALFQGDESRLQQLQILLKEARHNGWYQLMCSIYHDLGIYFHQKGEIQDALYNLTAASRLYEKIRIDLHLPEFKVGYMSKEHDVNERIAEFYGQLYSKAPKPKWAKALIHYEELQRARIIKDNLFSHPSWFPVRNNNTKTKKSEKFTSAKKSNSILLPISNSSRNLYFLNDVMYPIQTKPSSHGDDIDFNSLIPHIKRKNILIYHTTERTCFVLVILQNELKVIPLSTTRSELNFLVEKLIDPMISTSNDSSLLLPFHADAAWKLYTLLFQPVCQYIVPNSEILLIPSHTLARLPFDMLLKRKPERPIWTPLEEPGNVTNYLVNDYTFYYAPSLFLSQHTKSTTVRSKMLIVANTYSGLSDSSRHSFNSNANPSYLPYPRLEALNIKNGIPQTDVWENSCESQYKQHAAHYNILHFCGHAIIDTTYDLLSGLLMNPDSLDDGVLHGYEIIDGPFNHDLVTLSACRSGYGQTVYGEGVLALPRHFMLAGARSIIVAPWDVDDRFSSLFFPQFYRYYHEGHSKAEALQKAKLHILYNTQPYNGIHYQHPFFWAAYNLHGRADKEFGFAPVLRVLLACIFLGVPARLIY